MFGQLPACINLDIPELGEAPQIKAGQPALLHGRLRQITWDEEDMTTTNRLRGLAIFQRGRRAVIVLLFECQTGRLPTTRLDAVSRTVP
ncbi:hypothetical protein GCM10008179_30930 [Hansschlegelia plantiphila]|uniref:Uncharacterized protein n=1 Tax=Hansschlegelia plantiphila TaxID=374655 RepID=A0A9W6J576_9HYPH|nr:hypothetical protein GCM10008179_30930 [Hansschlegelia plantiphila]